jgi:hypothetical protein
MKRKKRRLKEKHKSIPSGQPIHAIQPSTKEEKVHPLPASLSESLSRFKRSSVASRWVAGIVTALSIAGVLLAFWQSYVDVPQIVSEVRVIFAVEKGERLPNGSIGTPKSVVITLGVFIANTGRRAVGVDRITVRSVTNGVGFNVQNYYDNFRLDAGDSKKINLSVELHYSNLSTPQPITIDMFLVDGTEISIDKGVITEGITIHKTEPTDKPYSPQITITDLWCNDERMVEARQIVGEKRYNHENTVDVTEHPELSIKHFVVYYYCSSIENRPQIKAYPTFFGNG